MTHNHANKCACCGKPITREHPAIASVTPSAAAESFWCADCWDNDPRAVEQFRAAGLADWQRLKEAVWRIQGIFADLTRRGRMPMYKFLIVDAEVERLAVALGIDPLDALGRKPK